MVIRLLVILLAVIAVIGIAVAKYGDHVGDLSLMLIGLLFITGPSVAGVAAIALLYGSFCLVFGETK